MEGGTRTRTVRWKDGGSNKGVDWVEVNKKKRGKMGFGLMGLGCLLDQAWEVLALGWIGVK